MSRILFFFFLITIISCNEKHKDAKLSQETELEIKNGEIEFENNAVYIKNNSNTNKYRFIINICTKKESDSLVQRDQISIKVKPNEKKYIGNKDSYNNDIFGNIIYTIKEESAIPVNLFKNKK